MGGITMKVEDIDINQQIGEVGKILESQEKERGILIHALQQIQEDNGYLPEDVLKKLSKKLNIALTRNLQRCKLLQDVSLQTERQKGGQSLSRYRLLCKGIKKGS